MTTTDVSPYAFLNTIFPDSHLNEGERVLITRPGKRGGMSNYYYHPRTAMLKHPAAWYYCLSTAQYRPHEFARRRLTDVRHAHVLVCDDIGTKCDAPPAEPNYILETSEGNFQYGYILLEPFDVSSPRNAAFFDGCLLGLANAGYNDPGCRSASRIVRLPGSMHRTGFKARLAYWEPWLCYDLPGLMDACGAEVADVRSVTPRKETNLTLPEVKDRVLDWLVKDSHVPFGHAGGGAFLKIICPWACEHTKEDEYEAGYSPLDYAFEGRSFNCFHASCAERSTGDFLQWVVENGGPSVATTEASPETFQAAFRGLYNEQ